MFMPVVRAILTTRQGIKDIVVNSETVCLLLVDCSFDRAIKTVLFIAKLRFYHFFVLCFKLFKQESGLV